MIPMSQRKGKNEQLFDAVKENESMSCFNPHLPLLSARWENLEVHHLCHPPIEMPEHATNSHVFTINLKSVNGSERRYEGEHNYEQVQVGDVALVPAYVNHWTVDTEDVEYLLLGLNPVYLTQIAYESMQPDRIHVLPQFTKPDPLVYGIGLELKSELELSGRFSHLYIESLTTTLYAHLLRRYISHSEDFRSFKGGLSRYKLNQALDYIHSYLETVKMAEVAEHIGMSQYHFCREFKQTIGFTPYQYILQQRIERAKRLLKNKVLLSTIALECGFADQSHLAKQFHKITGMTLKFYRNI